MVEGIRKAVGIHVFAGGFTAGVKDVFDVVGQLEVHGLGVKTTEEVWGVPVHLSRPSDWPDVAADFAFGNPRCTGFSCVTAGYGEHAHGPRAKQCQDILDFMGYSLSRFPVFVWESVQQAYTVGKPLLDELVVQCVDQGYRVAHVFVNARTFGNAQDRKRYFFVAYPKDKQFNVAMPAMYPYYPVLWDVIADKRDSEVNEWHPATCDYDENSVVKISADEKQCLPHLATGWSLNQAVQYCHEYCPPKFQKIWDDRTSGMPFSMHCVFRTSWLRPCPTLKNSAGRLIHPWHHRPLTIGELAACMGWRGRVPTGPDPVSQIAKGIVPDVGTWIAQQVTACLNDTWGGDEWSTTFDHVTGTFKGEDSRGHVEKVIDVTKYHGHLFDIERYPDEPRAQRHRFNVDPVTGKLIRDWKDMLVARR